MVTKFLIHLTLIITLCTLKTIILLIVIRTRTNKRIKKNKNNTIKNKNEDKIKEQNEDMTKSRPNNDRSIDNNNSNIDKWNK